MEDNDTKREKQQQEQIISSSSSSSTTKPLTLLVNDNSDRSLLGGKSFTIWHARFAESLVVCNDGELTTLKQGEHALRIDARTGGMSFEFDQQPFRHIYKESYGLLEDSSAFDDEVWTSCKEWLDNDILLPLGLPTSRSGWVSFFDALPWRACACHVQLLKVAYV